MISVKDAALLRAKEYIKLFYQGATIPIPAFKDLVQEIEEALLEDEASTDD